ncbi:DUF5086 family protein [Mesorhizobium sp. A623]
MKTLPISILLSLAGAVTASAQTLTETIVLSVTRQSVTWATVYKNPDALQDDPYFHVQVFEKKKGAEPWVYKLVSPHLVVTPEALAASRTSKKAAIPSYKDVEFRYLYRDCLQNPETRSNAPICENDILDCVSRQ